MNTADTTTKIDTGLCDKLGNRVFLGDTIQFMSNCFHPDLKCVVVSIDGEWYCQAHENSAKWPLDSVLDEGIDKWSCNHVIGHNF